MSRYTIVAIILHWVMATLLLFMIWLGWNMDDNEVRFQMHKSIGITILFLTVVRIIWRWRNPPPVLPDDMPAYEKLASHTVHMGFYALMVILPLAGWLLVTISEFKVPTVLYGAISWPHLPVPAAWHTDLLHTIVETIHSKGAWVLIALLALHVAGAIKHEVAAETGVLKRMIPRFFGTANAPKEPARGYIRAFGIAGVLFTLITLIPFMGRGVTPSKPDQTTPSGASQPAISPNWDVDYETSEIRFTGIYDGTEFSGTFRNWTADVEFYPDNLEQSEVRVTIQTASANAGKKLYNDSLKGQEWFDTATFPAAKVRLTNFAKTDDGYTADARIMIKTDLETVPLSFTLDIEDDTATLNGTTVLNRKDMNLGQASDPAGTWVGEEITVTVSGSATRK